MLRLPPSGSESPSGLPFADLRSLIVKAPSFNSIEANATMMREQKMPSGRGRLSDIAVWLAGWQGRAPSIRRPELCLFAGASALGHAERQQQARAAAQLQIVLLSSGGSASNSLAQAESAGLRVFDLAIDQPGGLISATEAMSELGCARAFAFGMEAVAQNADLLCLAGFGPGSRETAAACAYGLLGGQASDWILPGMATDALAFLNDAKALRGSDDIDALELLRCCGSRELAALCGAIVAARTQQIPVIIDGFIATVAATLLANLQPGAIDHCLLSGRDGSAAHDRLIHHLSLRPLLDMQISTMDGMGALLAVSIVRAAAILHNDLTEASSFKDLEATNL